MNTKAILTLFGFSLEDIPDNTFTPGKSEVTRSGDLLLTHHKQFNEDVFGIFEEIEVRNIGGSCNNIIFKANSLDKIPVNKVENLINKLHSIYGKDDDDKEKFSREDLQLFNDKDFYMLFGRSWMGLENNLQYPCAVDIDKENNFINLTVWGVGLTKANV